MCIPKVVSSEENLGVNGLAIEQENHCTRDRLVYVRACEGALLKEINRFLLGTGRKPHPVGGAMGVALCTALKREYTRFDIISLNIHKATSRLHLPGCRTLTSTADFCCLARHPTNCSTALPKVFSSDLPVCQCIRTHMLV